MPNLDYVARITGTGKVVTELNGVNSAIGRQVTTGKAVESSYARQQALLGGVRTAAAALGVTFGGILITREIKSWVDASIEFESAFAGVRKTVSASEAEFAVLSDGLREMAQTMPTSVIELARIAEAAGQLGIKTADILDFTKVMADLGVTTNLSSDAAATALARLVNITGNANPDFNALGSTIVALGNNMATTEAEIVNFALRIAAAGTQVGLTEADILGFSAALSSVGIRAEAGGTAISRIFVEIDKAVSLASPKLELFAQVAGQSIDEFSAAFRDNAAQATLQFIEGLNALGDAGGSVNLILDQMGLDGIRVAQALKGLAGAGDLNRFALELASRAYEEHNALVLEAAQRYETSESKIATFSNVLNEWRIQLGDKVVPAITHWIEGMQIVTDVIANRTIPWLKNFDDALNEGKLSVTAWAVQMVVGAEAAQKWRDANTDTTEDLFEQQLAFNNASVVIEQYGLDFQQLAVRITDSNGVIIESEAEYQARIIATSELIQRRAELELETNSRRTAVLKAVYEAEIELINAASEEGRLKAAAEAERLAQATANWETRKEMLDAETAAIQEINANIIAGTGIEIQSIAALMEARSEAVNRRMIEHGLMMVQISKSEADLQSELQRLRDEAHADTLAKIAEVDSSDRDLNTKIIDRVHQTNDEREAREKETAEAEIQNRQEVLEEEKRLNAERERDYRRIWNEIRIAAGDTFLAMLETGTFSFQALGDFFRNYFINVIFQQIIGAWVADFLTPFVQLATQALRDLTNFLVEAIRGAISSAASNAANEAIQAVGERVRAAGGTIDTSGVSIGVSGGDVDIPDPGILSTLGNAALTFGIGTAVSFGIGALVDLIGGIGEGRRTADEWVQGVHDPAMSELFSINAAYNAALNDSVPNTVGNLVGFRDQTQSLWNSYQSSASSFASGGDVETTVINQALATATPVFEGQLAEMNATLAFVADQQRARGETPQSFITGIDSIPGTKPMEVIVHPGERIVPAHQNRPGMLGGTSITISPTIIVNGAGLDADRIARVSTEQIQRIVERMVRSNAGNFRGHVKRMARAS